MMCEKKMLLLTKKLLLSVKITTKQKKTWEKEIKMIQKNI